MWPDRSVLIGQKIGGKCQNSNGTFWGICKQRDSILLSEQTLVYWYYSYEIFIELQKRPLGHPSFDVLINRNDRRRCLGFWDRKMWEEAFFKCLREKQGTPTKMSQFLRHLCFVSYRKLMIVQYQKLPLKISTFRIFFNREHIVWKILKILHLNFWHLESIAESLNKMLTILLIRQIGIRWLT